MPWNPAFMVLENMTQKKIRILLVGPQALLISGTRILFRQLVECLRERGDVDLVVLDTCGVRGAGLKTLPRLVGLVFKLFTSARNCDVISFHFTLTGIPFIGPFVVMIARFWRKPLVSRQFGGMQLSQLSRAKQAVTRWFINQSKVYIVETKELMRSLEKDGVKNLHWYPNSRPLPKNRPPPAPRGQCVGKFIFIGHLRVGKGVQVLIEAAETSDLKLQVDVYGPWYDLPRNAFDGCKRVQYKGELLPDKVLSTIEEYDALVLPTFFVDEGHPGVIIEAYQAGRPVIGTRWKALPEIVIEEETGLLAEPRDVASLQKSFARLMESPELYRRLAAGALEFGKQFSAEARAEELVNLCRSVATRK